MALKFVDELPEGVKKKSNGSKIFNDELAAELQAHPGKWALIPDGTGQRAKAFQKRRGDTDGYKFEYETIDTGKPNGPKRKSPNNPDVCTSRRRRTSTCDSTRTPSPPRRADRAEHQTNTPPNGNRRGVVRSRLGGRTDGTTGADMRAQALSPGVHRPVFAVSDR